MICPNLRIGAPAATAATAILWPLGTRSRAVTPSGRGAGGNFVDRDDHIVGIVETQGAGRGHGFGYHSRVQRLGRKQFGSLSGDLSKTAPVTARWRFIASRAAAGSPAAIASAIAACSRNSPASGRAATSSGVARARDERADCRGPRSRAPCRADWSEFDGTRRRARRRRLVIGLDRGCCLARDSQRARPCRRASAGAPPPPRSRPRARCG